VIQASSRLSRVEFQQLQQNIDILLQRLNGAIEHAEDLPEGQLAPLLQNPCSASRVGRPKLEANEASFAQGFAAVNGSSTRLAKLLGCSPRTVRRRALELGWAKPGSPVYTEVHEGPQIRREYHRREPKTSTLPTDEALDALTAEFVEAYPRSGNIVMQGWFSSKGHIVSRSRLRESYKRIKGFPSAFQRTCISRRVYQVAGPNSLWHHDGYHSMLSYLPQRISLTIIQRTNTLEDGGTWIHRWLFSLCSGSTGIRKQSCIYSV
jgi:hypothetical protein